MAGGNSRLHLLVNPVALPLGRVGVAYPRTRIVFDGVPGYAVTVEGKLPAGLALGDDGYLAGTPTAAGASRFLVHASDNAVPPGAAQQAYTVRIAVAGGRTPAKPASGASAPQPLKDLTADDTSPPATPVGPFAMAWSLAEADVDALAPDPNAPAEPPPAAAAEAPASATANAPAGAAPPANGASAAVAVSDQSKAAADAVAARASQRHLMLAPLVGVEYPSRQLFESALDAQLCKRVLEIIAQAERTRGLPQSGGTGVTCPPTPTLASSSAAASASKPAKSAASAPPPEGGPVPLAQLPEWLLPPDLRRDILAKAMKIYGLDKAQPITWTGGDCGCVHENIAGELYGFYPFWAANGKPQRLDFSLLTRVAAHAATFDDSGDLQQPVSWLDPRGAFAAEARRHGTKLDFVVWRSDWKTLLALDDVRLDRAVRTLAGGAVRAADAALRDDSSWWSGYLPFYAGQPARAQGLSIFFDDYPRAATDPAGAQAFNAFVRKFLLAVIDQMRKGAPRTYTLNLVVPGPLIGAAPFEYETLFDYVKRAEEPTLDHDRIQDEGDRPSSRTNVTVRFVVLLAEPTTATKKTLRRSLDEARGIYGNDRRIMLRKIIAGVSYNGADPQQFADDLAYFRDNFGGAALWQVPQEGAGAGSATNDAINLAFRKDAKREPLAVCRWICTYRWEVRAAFKLLAAAVLLGLVGVAAMGGMRCAGRRYMMVLLAAAILMIVTGIGLLNCDIEIKELREGNKPFIAVLAGLLALALYAALKPRDPRP
jgi:hypothetical protein